jgi:hypothetical protein
MNVRVSKEFLVKSGVWKDGAERENRFYKYSRWGSDTDRFVVDMNLFSGDELKKLEKAAAAQHEWRALAHKLKVYKRLIVATDTELVKKLISFEPSFKSVLLKTPNKWLFTEGLDGHMLPCYIENAKYYPARCVREDFQPPYVQIRLRSSEGSESINIGQESLGSGVVIPKFLQSKGWYIENEELVANYLKEVDSFLKEKPNTGKQFLAFGHAESSGGSYWDSSRISMERDGRPARVVMDHNYKEQESDSGRSRDRDNDGVSTEYWLDRDELVRRKNLTDEEDLAELDSMETTPPLHPFLNVFDLQKHRHVEIHISNLKPYVYDETINEKLILPKEKKDLVGILVQGGNLLMEDIIEGKTGGIIVLATGIPGTGKTLTAEVYAEAVKKPLYVVQCSQLGTDEGSIEKTLSLILQRASRWAAILLIDEADVYVRERGTDIHQNAIVGVFLRVLEYYRGVLFMTSNRATIIDDAVMSRTTAHITYEAPEAEERARIWEVLSTQFKMKLVGSYDTFAKAFPKVTGRTIKNLLKLSMLISLREKKPVDLKLVRYAAKFLDGTDGGQNV